MNRKIILAGALWIACHNLYAQTIYSGQVLDLATRLPISQAIVQIKGSDKYTVTNTQGEFRLSIDGDSVSTSEIKIRGHVIYWNLPSSAVLKIYNLAGQETGHNYKLNVGEGEITIEGLFDGIYIIRADLANGESYHAKYLYDRYIQNNSLQVSFTAGFSLKSLQSNDSISISKGGYFTQDYALVNNYSEYFILSVSNPASIDYFTELIRPEAFKLMQSQPLNPVFSEIKSIKLCYSISEDKIYYINSSRYFIHYDFARDILNYEKGHSTFNQEQYTNNPNRIYILATLNHFVSSGIYTLDFFSGDELTCEQIETVYHKVAGTTYIGNNLKFYSNSLNWENCQSIPTITSDELFAGQNYQPLNPEEAYGYLRKFTLEDLKTEYAGRHDIVLLNGIPNDISVVAGIITTEFQTPLSHINVLSHNRGAPNMALRDGWTNPQLETLHDKLVYLKVTLDTFILREATLSEAQAFWANKEPSEPTILQHDTITRGIIELTQESVESTRLVGGKASNFAELMKISVTGYGPLPLPEDAFAIPFYYYWHHIQSNSLDVLIRQIISEPRFQTDYQYRRQQLVRFQDSIKTCPVDPELLTLINSRLGKNSEYTNIRFRSSTNSEDIKGFNGAGLYDSYTGIPGDPDKTIEDAIRKVWASLWNIAAYEEREYFKIDQLSVAMAILVHRSFPDEAANGVVITENLYNQYNPGFTINVQIGEISITNPEGGYTPDQIIKYSWDDIIEYINHSNVPGMEGKTVLSNSEILELSDYCQAIHNHYCMLNQGCQPLDIEFKVDVVNGVRKIYIKQARLY